MAIAIVRARPRDPQQLVGDHLMARREDRAEGRQDDVERRVLERQRLGVGLDPLQLQPRSRAAASPTASSSGVRSEATTSPPASAAGIDVAPEPAATSSTRCPDRTPAAATSVGPTSLIVSRATRGKSPVAHIARVRALKARSSSLSRSWHDPTPGRSARFERSTQLLNPVP